jgi:biotin carboxyl carrier protein
MSLYNVQISGRQYQVEIMGEQVKLNGRQINVGLMPSDHPGLFSFIQGKRKRDLFLQHQMNGTYAITTEGRQMVAEVELDSGHGAEKTADSSADEDKLRAPMPGVVLHVHTAEGERVSEGQLLVTLESMKMQMEFRAPFEGDVVEVAVQPGQKVEKAALMVVLQRS